MSDELVDIDPNDPRWGHHLARGDGGVRLHYVRQGRGDPVLLLHGWPGFWYDWRRILPRLRDECDLVAPDLRGFGTSDAPTGDPADLYGPDAHIADMLALLDHLEIERVVVAAHDIGATIAQGLARRAPQRVGALALFDPPYLGIGKRRFEPDVQPEFWYQHLHTKPWAQDLIGHSRETVRVYLAHFYDHWVGRREAVTPREFEHIVDAYARPGAVRASIEYYRARAGQRAREADASPANARIHHPTVILWGAEDPVMQARWSDRIPEFFPNADLTILPGVGHFVPFEAPDEAAAAIREAVRRA